MEIDIQDLRRRPMINWNVPYSWMSKMSPSEIEKWESEFIEEAKRMILLEKREVKSEEVMFRLQKEASFLENEYNFFKNGLT